MDYKLKYLKYKKKYLALKNKKLKGGKTETIKNKDTIKIKKGKKLFNFKKKIDVDYDIDENKKNNIKKLKDKSFLNKFQEKMYKKAIEYSFKFKCESGNCKDGYGTLKSNRGKYVGQIKNNLPNGEGIYTENYGPVYKSIWKNGLIMTGPSSISFNGDETSGVMIDNKWDGWVKITELDEKNKPKPNRIIVETKFENGKELNYNKLFEYSNNILTTSSIFKDNVTEVFLPNGDKIKVIKYENDQAEFFYNYNNGDEDYFQQKNGQNHGKFKITKKYRIITGNFKDGKLDGEQITRFSDSEERKSIWKDGVEQSYIYTDKDGSVIKTIDGKFKIKFENGDLFEGESSEKGKYTDIDGNIFEGEWVDGWFNGNVKLIYSNGDVYEGYSIYGILFGKGKLTKKDGTVQDGYWIENIFVNITDCSGNCSDGYGEVDYKDKELNIILFKYKGQWKDKVPHGKGELTDADGNIYKGQLKYGLYWGKGKIKYTDGVYKGEFKNGLGEGQGKYTTTDGDVYKGEFKNGLFEGQGKMTYSDGSVYKGEWKKGFFEGRGKITYSDGSVYEGEFKNDKYEGQGKMTYSDGSVYEGEFKNDKYEGQGKFTFPNGSVGSVYEGEFKNNKWEGQGKMTYSNGSVYEGEFKNNKWEGQGKMTYSDGSIYEGQFKSAKRHGQGKMTYGNVLEEGEYLYDEFQGIYVGERKNGLPDGQGKMTYYNGYVFEGKFKNGFKHGKGKFTYTNGNFEEGEWYHNLLNGFSIQTYINDPDKVKEEKNYIMGNQFGKSKTILKNGDIIEKNYFMRRLYEPSNCVKGDCINGYGEIDIYDGDVTYKGEFKDGLPHGKGIFENMNGLFYDGEWENGYSHGYGKYKGKNEYEGEFKYSKYHGKGKLIKNLDDEIKKIEEGQFEYGHFIG